MLRIKTAVTLAALGTAAALAAGPASAASGWTIVSAPPTGQNANLQGVSAVSDSDAWAVGLPTAPPTRASAPRCSSTTGTAWPGPRSPRRPPRVTPPWSAVSASSATDAWAVGHTQVNKSGFAPLALHWNGTAWSVSPSAATALSASDSASRTGVADISPTDAYAIGGGLAPPSDSLAQWNGTTWSRVTVPLPNNDNIQHQAERDIRRRPGDVWIVGTFLDSATGRNETFSRALQRHGLERGADAAGEQPEHQRVLPLQRRSRRTAPAMCGRSATAAWSTASSQRPSSSTATGRRGASCRARRLGRSTSSGVTTSKRRTTCGPSALTSRRDATRAQTLTLNWNGTAWTTGGQPQHRQHGRARRRGHQPRGRDRLGGRRERGLWLVQSARAPERLTAGCAPRPVRVTRTGRGVRSPTC